MTTEKLTRTTPDTPIQTQILGEYYFRKGNLTTALDIFLQLNQMDPQHYNYCYYLGKIYYRLGNLPKAAEYLTSAKDINPLHRQTLLLLHHCYSRSKDYHKAFECILDLYILAKEVKDQHIYYYEKRIRSTSRKIEGFTAQKKSKLLKGRVEALQNFFLSLEKTRQSISKAAMNPTEELSPDMGRKLQNFDQVDEDQDQVTPLRSPVPIEPSDEHEPEESEKLLEQDEENPVEDDIQFDTYNPDDASGPTLVQTFVDEQTFVDDHSLDPAPTPPPMEEPTPEPVVEEINDTIENTVIVDTQKEVSEETFEKFKKKEEKPPVSPTHLRDALLQVAFLRQLNKEKLDKIQHFTSILEFQEGETVFAENDPVFGFHILLKGEIEIRKGSESIHHYTAPKIIDEDDFFRVNYRSFSLVSKAPSVILFFNKAGYQNLYQRDAKTAIMFLWHFTQSLSQKIDGCIEEVLLQTPNESFIEELDQKHEVSNLRKLTDQEIKVLSSLFDPISLKRKEKIYSQQENRKYFYVLLEGSVECSNPKRNPIVIQKNEYFGEMVFCGPGYPHLYDAFVVSENAKLLQISYKQLSSLAQFEESEQKFLADMLVRMLSNKNKELRELLYQTRYLKNKG